ncbi:MAG: hypothetical protein V2I27_00270 [Erythrobacter sp.]|nr:hypothetical protein [Erythrobacter sp.]
MSEATKTDPQMCSQCGKRLAVMTIGSAPICIPCEHTFQQSRYMVFAQNASMMNYASQELDMVVGIGPRSPKVEIPPAPVPPLYYNNQNLNVSGGVIGAVNFGTASSIQVSLKEITENGILDLADALADLTNAIMNSQDLESSAKNDLLDQVSVVAEQAKVEPTARKPGLIKGLLSALKEGAGAIASVSEAWNSAEPLLQRHFGF